MVPFWNEALRIEDQTWHGSSLVLDSDLSEFAAWSRLFSLPTPTSFSVGEKAAAAGSPTFLTFPKAVTHLVGEPGH